MDAVPRHGSVTPELRWDGRLTYLFRKLPHPMPNLSGGIVAQLFRNRFPHAMRRSRISAGLLMYRHRDGLLEVFVAHPGGPWFPHRDLGIWTIPKGEIEPGEEPLDAAMREFMEEVGIAPSGPYIELGSIRQKGGKTVHAWGFHGEWDEHEGIRSNRVNIEWPPGSGVWALWPEIDRAGFFTPEAAKERMKPAQHPFIDRLILALEASPVRAVGR